MGTSETQHIASTSVGVGAMLYGFIRVGAVHDVTDRQITHNGEFRWEVAPGRYSNATFPVSQIDVKVDPTIGVPMVSFEVAPVGMFDTVAITPGTLSTLVAKYATKAVIHCPASPDDQRLAESGCEWSGILTPIRSKRVARPRR